MQAMPESRWPDELQKPDPTRVAALLHDFWRELAALPDLLAREEHLLCATTIHALRACVVEMMLALNGIAYPAGTRHLNRYLGPSQRAALEKTLYAPTAAGTAPVANVWIGQAVALVVIYRWYAPQLIAACQLSYPATAETQTLALLQEKLPDWPTIITTD